MDMEDSDEEEKKDGGDGEDDEDDDDNTRHTPIRGTTPRWGSCVRLVDPGNACSTLDCVEMNRNEAALCCASVRFHTVAEVNLCWWWGPSRA